MQRVFFPVPGQQQDQEYTPGFLLLLPSTCANIGVLDIGNVRPTKAVTGASCCSFYFQCLYTWGSQEYCLAGVAEIQHFRLCSKLLLVLWLPYSSQRVCFCLRHATHGPWVPRQQGMGLHLVQGRG